jgi:hypothetical protein
MLSDGGVNFCCFSDAVVGNVNQNSFEEIWNGETMQGIRSELTEQRLPRECQSTSCPIYRGDDLHYILDRMEGRNRFAASGTHDPHRQLRERLEGSKIEVHGDHPRIGKTLELSVDLKWRGEPSNADLFIAISRPDGQFCFLPTNEEFPLPFLCVVGLAESGTPLRFDARASASCFPVAGNYQLCAALFETNSNPNLLSNCYWSETRTLAVS